MRWFETTRAKFPLFFRLWLMIYAYATLLRFLYLKHHGLYRADAHGLAFGTGESTCVHVRIHDTVHSVAIAASTPRFDL